MIERLAAIATVAASFHKCEERQSVLGNEDSGIAVDGGGSVTDAGEFHSRMLNGFIEELDKELSNE